MTDVDEAVIKKTQDRLSKYFKKPPLTEKLLNRPPFRFLHDIVTAIISNTGFMKGLFTDDELKSDNIKDKEMKIQFLEKVLKMVSVALNKTIDVKPSSIVAGKEATKTNIFLQELGKAIEKKDDNKKLVSQVLSGNAQVSSKEKSKESSKEKSKELSKEKTKDSKSSDKSKKEEDGKSLKKTESDKRESFHGDKKEKKESSHGDKKDSSHREQKSSKPREKKHESKPEEKQKSSPQKQASKEINLEDDVMQKETEIQGEIKNFEEQENQTKLQRPSSAKGSRHRHERTEEQMVINDEKNQLNHAPTARPAPPKIRKLPDNELADIPNPQSKVTGLIIDNDKDSDDDYVVEEYIGGGEIDTNFGKKDDEENEEDEVHGALVKKIIESKKDFTENETINLTSLNDTNRKRERFNTQKEIEKIRSSLQIVTKHIHPIGKLIDFLQEDIDTMQKEYEKWRKEKLDLMKKYNVENNVTDKLIRPIKDKIDEQNNTKKEYNETLAKLKAQITNNAKKIDLILVNSCSAVS